MKRKLALSKMYMSRTAGYLALVNAGMILFLVLTRLEDYGMDIKIESYFLPILLGGFVVLAIFGWLEDKLGFHQLEREHVEKRNPYMDKILKKLDKIEREIKKHHK